MRIHEQPSEGATNGALYHGDVFILQEERTGMQVTEAKTVFAEVLAELMQSKGIDPTPEAMKQLAERSGLDVGAFEARLASDGAEFPGYLNRLADELELDENERMRLAHAFAFELRLPEEERSKRR